METPGTSSSPGVPLPESLLGKPPTALPGPAFRWKAVRLGGVGAAQALGRVITSAANVSFIVLFMDFLPGTAALCKEPHMDAITHDESISAAYIGSPP